MNAPISRRPLAAELDAMISRAEAACERYRLHAEKLGERLLTERHRATHRVMEETLERLRQQRDGNRAGGRPGAP
jgi:hypothetical protein